MGLHFQSTTYLSTHSKFHLSVIVQKYNTDPRYHRAQPEVSEKSH
jgi:hypothetical protein